MNLYMHLHSVVQLEWKSRGCWRLQHRVSVLTPLRYIVVLFEYRGAIDSLLRCIYLLSFGHFITLEVMPNDEAERLVTIIYCLWRVFEVLMW